MQIEGMTEELAQRLVEQGYLSYDDLSVIEPDALMEMGGMTEEQVDAIVTQSETLAEQAEKAADDERRRKKAEAIAAEAAGEAAPQPAAAPADIAEPAATEPVAEEPTAEAPSASEPASGNSEPATNDVPAM
jgi:N utilization substance protein A